MLRDQSEKLLHSMGSLFVRRPWIFIALSIVILLFSLFQLRHLEIDTTTEAFFEKNDPSILEFEQFKNEFGRDLQFNISIKDANLFSTPVMSELIRLHKALEEKIPYVQEVNSLYNARDIYGLDGELVVDGFFEELPENAEYWEKSKQRALAHPFYRNVFITDDGQMANIYVRPAINYEVNDINQTASGFVAIARMIKLYAGIDVMHWAGVEEKQADEPKESVYATLGEVQIHEMNIAIKAVLKDFPALTGKVYMSGTPVITDELSYYLVQDMLKFIGLAVLAIAIILYVMFRALWAVVLPLLVVILALIATMALMSITGQALQSPTVILPSFIMAVGISNSIHLISHFLVEYNKGVSKNDAIVSALTHCGVPIFFAVATTAVGLCSFGTADIVPIANLGLFSAAGIVFAYIFSMVLLPSLLAWVSVKPEKYKSEKSVTVIDGFIEFSIRLTQTYTVSIVVIGLSLSIVVVVLAAQLHFSHDPIKWLPDDSPGRIAMEVVSKKIGGSVAVEVVVDTGEIDGVKNADFINRIELVVDDLKAHETEQIKPGSIMAITTLLKETNRALFDNDEAEYKIPASSELIAQEFLMLEASGAADLFRLVSQDYQKARITVFIPWVDALYLGDYVLGMESIVSKRFSQDVTVSVTGVVPMLAKTLRKIMNATAISYVIAFFCITLMMILLLRSVSYGLMSILPNVFPIAFVMALMYINKAPLDMFSMLIGSIGLGLAVDDTIHFCDGFKKAFGKTGNAAQAVADTLRSSGKAMLCTSIILSLGFLIYLFSPMHNLQNFGLYSALCIAAALLADFWMMPALLLLWHRNDGNGKEVR